MSSPLSYPIELDAQAIEEVLPHRGEILCVRRITVLDCNHCIGHVIWAPDLPILQGHFPSMPMVPGALLIEAVAQVAGAGMLVGDVLARSMRGSHVGVLAGVRKCSFKRPVQGDEWVRVEVRSRQMSAMAAAISAQLQIGAEEVASIDLLLVNTPRSMSIKPLLSEYPPAAEEAAVFLR
ncbi:MAG: 3-hydroxyacyl-ACP dehydratase [Thiomonas sp.]|nr:3-hydroxyacyl-ACP dehydratase [Thiomonas sp.]